MINQAPFPFVALTDEEQARWAKETARREAAWERSPAGRACRARVARQERERRLYGSRTRGYEPRH